MELSGFILALSLGSSLALLVRAAARVPGASGEADVGDVASAACATSVEGKDGSGGYLGNLGRGSGAYCQWLCLIRPDCLAASWYNALDLPHDAQCYGFSDAAPGGSQSHLRFFAMHQQETPATTLGPRAYCEALRHGVLIESAWRHRCVYLGCSGESRGEAGTGACARHAPANSTAKGLLRLDQDADDHFLSAYTASNSNSFFLVGGKRRAGVALGASIADYDWVDGEDAVLGPATLPPGWSFAADEGGESLIVELEYEPAAVRLVQPVPEAFKAAALCEYSLLKERVPGAPMRLRVLEGQSSGTLGPFLIREDASVRSLEACMVRCAREAGCQSAAYSESGGSCRLYSASAASDQLQADSDWTLLQRSA